MDGPRFTPRGQSALPRVLTSCGLFWAWTRRSRAFCCIKATMERKSNALKRESHSHENAQFNRVHVDLCLCRDQGRSHRHRQLGSSVGHSLAIRRARARAAPAHARPNIAAALRCSARQASRRRPRRHASFEPVATLEYVPARDKRFAAREAAIFGLVAVLMFRPCAESADFTCASAGRCHKQTILSIDRPVFC